MYVTLLLKQKELGTCVAEQEAVGTGWQGEPLVYFLEEGRPSLIWLATAFRNRKVINLNQN
jgi:hypothetical protein